MGKTNIITKIFLLLVTIIGIIALILLIIGVATRKWLSVSSSLSPLETQISGVLSNTTFLTSLIIATRANQTQVVQIVLATAQKVKEQLNNAAANHTTYHLYGKDPNIPETSLSFKSSQGFVFAGIGSIFFGILLAIIITLLPLPRIIRLLPLLLLITGPILITIGFVLYPKIVIEDFGDALDISIDVGYSIILVIIASIIGYITAVLFAFIILQQRQNSPQKPSTRAFTPRSIFRPSYPIRMKRSW
ncbi:unnamed protein product [Adineta ricciae]|uniref:Uncharacterized protein n=1 Tax=Adineta ricciae TaxID=249248 RepID=A0A815VS98_ADIRI|nr:unnamed protein product [Adineta ricciae]CAF1662206.1 unnamed protein product [Adineta ricciae]